jgi:hypothetical protein
MFSFVLICRVFFFFFFFCAKKSFFFFFDDEIRRTPLFLVDDELFNESMNVLCRLELVILDEYGSERRR